MQIANQTSSKGTIKYSLWSTRQCFKQQSRVRDRRSSKSIRREIESLKLCLKKKFCCYRVVPCKFYEEETEGQKKSIVSLDSQSMSSTSRSCDDRQGDNYDEDSILQVLQDYQSQESSCLSQSVCPFEGVVIVPKKIKIKDYLQYLSRQQQSHHK